jgi:hypothetical protein
MPETHPTHWTRGARGTREGHHALIYTGDTILIVNREAYVMPGRTADGRNEGPNPTNMRYKAAHLKEERAYCS